MTSVIDLDCDERRPARRIVAIGQLSVDTVVLLDRHLNIRDQTTGSFFTVPGGTAAIVAHNASVLGGRCSFVGHAGSAAADLHALARLAEVGVYVDEATLSGECLRVTILVDPDGERTMVSNAAVVSWANISPSFKRSDVVYFEGWHLFDASTRRDYVSLICSAADAGATVAIDVCSARRNVADAHGALLRKLPVDLMFANENEASAYDLIESPPEAALVVHRGARPTVLMGGEQRSEVPLERVRTLDTTGAGDTFAAGFLVAVAGGADLLEAVQGGHDAARRIVQTIGALLPVPAGLPEAVSQLTKGAS